MLVVAALSICEAAGHRLQPVRFLIRVCLLTVLVSTFLQPFLSTGGGGGGGGCFQRRGGGVPKSMSFTFVG